MNDKEILDRNAKLSEGLSVALNALNFISNGVRSDGSYNYDREGCKHLAIRAIDRIKKIMDTKNND